MIGPTGNEIASALSERAEQVCQHLLPSGTARGGNWVVGDAQGSVGKSLQVRLEGERAGLWIDFSSGDKGNLLNLWSQNHGISMKDAAIEAAAWLGTPLEEEERTRNSPTWATLQKEMGTGTDHDVADLAALRKLPTDAGIRAAIEHRVLFFGPVGDGDYAHHSWIVTDDARMGAQARRMDGKPWINGQKTKTIHGTTGRWPIGCANAGTLDIALVEGGPDILAAYTALSLLGLTDSIQPVAILGSSQHIHPSAGKHLGNRTIWLFPHNDENLAGLQGAVRWTAHLRKLGSSVIPFDFQPYGVKDLNDFVSALAQPAKFEE